jgi:hypothetical protein
VSNTLTEDALYWSSNWSRGVVSHSKTLENVAWVVSVTSDANSETEKRIKVFFVPKVGVRPVLVARTIDYSLWLELVVKRVWALILAVKIMVYGRPWALHVFGFAVSDNLRLYGGLVENRTTFSTLLWWRDLWATRYRLIAYRVERRQQS